MFQVGWIMCCHILCCEAGRPHCAGLCGAAGRGDVVFGFGWEEGRSCTAFIQKNTKGFTILAKETKKQIIQKQIILFSDNVHNRFNLLLNYLLTSLLLDTQQIDKCNASGKRSFHSVFSSVDVLF